MLHDSAVRIDAADSLGKERIVHLRWDGQKPQFVPSVKYTLVETITLDKQVVDTYRLTSE